MAFKAKMICLLLCGRSAAILTFTDIFCLKPERSYKKSKKHKKKGKKRRHKSVSIQEDPKIHLLLFIYCTLNVHLVFVCALMVIMATRHRQTLTMRRKEESAMENVKRT